TVVAIERDTPVRCKGRPVTVITIIQENMPFIFDSVLGEITEATGEPFLVLHPILSARTDASGSPIVGEASEGAAGTARISVVHVHASPLSETAAAELRTSLERILTQVRAAVSDW